MSLAAAAPSPRLSYKVSMPEPHTHYFKVEINLQNLRGKSINMKMPVWTPGSYLVREFSRNVENVEARAGQQVLPIEMTAKNTWNINLKGQKNITFSYKVYAFEHTVRTSYLDSWHGYINGASTFAYPDGMTNLPVTLTIVPHPDFKKISTSLDMVNGQPDVREAPNYDILVDSPIEIGNHEIFTFDAAGVSHEVAMYAAPTYYNQPRLKKDMIAIVEAATKVFGKHPCKKYLFIVHHTENSRGGLEHLNSTSLVTPRYVYFDDKSYKDFLGLVSHEYFHLWNVKRVRPKALGPFNYEEENYTHQLWQAEGFTSYYDDLLLLRAGLLTEEEYLGVIARNINGTEQTPGNSVQSVAQSSWEAWTKYYRQDEHSRNAIVSYYTKGSVLALLLDLDIRHSSQSKYSLDDVMQHLYNEYYLGKHRGFTEEELKAALEKFTGHSLTDFFANHVHGTKPIDYKKYMDYAALFLSSKDNEDQTGASFTEANNSLVISRVLRDTPAWQSGLNARDEVLAVDGFRIHNLKDFKLALEARTAGEAANVLVSRQGILKEISYRAGKNPYVTYTVSKSEEAKDTAKEVRTKWLK